LLLAPPALAYLGVACCRPVRFWQVAAVWYTACLVMMVASIIQMKCADPRHGQYQLRLGPHVLEHFLIGLKALLVDFFRQPLRMSPALPCEPFTGWGWVAVAVPVGLALCAWTSVRSQKSLCLLTPSRLAVVALAVLLAGILPVCVHFPVRYGS